MDIHISEFRSEDQEASRSLVLDGLTEHWGAVDASLNPDLDDIAANYRSEQFLTAWHGDRLVGCGALIPRTSIEAEIVRMSVNLETRRRGVGTAVLRALLGLATRQGFGRIVLETTATWSNAIAF